MALAEILCAAVVYRRRRVCGACRDINRITEAVNAETALLYADRCKDEFLATLAHELRNPLAPITNALGIIERPDGAAAVPRLLPVINRQVNHMVRLVDDLLEISRITVGRLSLRQFGRSGCGAGQCCRRKQGPDQRKGHNWIFPA